MTPDEAHQQLTSAYERGLMDPISRVAWQALDEALKSGARLPELWERLSATPAAERAGKSSGAAWTTMMSKGYAPAPDGTDPAGRAVWMVSTVDAYVSGEWKPPAGLRTRDRSPDAPPPIAGRGSSRDAWAAWATAHGVTVLPKMRQAAIREECRKAGLIT